jgi:hypothetical protein
VANKLFPLVLHRHKSINETGHEIDECDELVGNVLHDGDEFVFKLTSFDRWIQVTINFHLKGHSNIRFSSRREMRVVGYFPNSHFFNLIQKLVIDEWNDYIEANRGKKDYYILKDISFRNRKTVIERVNQESDGAGVLKYVKSPSNHLEEVGKDVNKERAKIKINKKNYVAREINLNKKVEETFGYEG